MDVDCREGGSREGGSGEEKDDDMAECGEGGDGECVLSRGDGEWGCEDGARGEDDSKWGKWGSGHWRLCGRKRLQGMERMIAMVRGGFVEVLDISLPWDGTDSNLLGTVVV